MPLSRSQRAKAALIAALGAPAIAALGRTLRWRVEGAQHHDAVLASGRQPILALWHGRIFGGILYWQRRGFVVMTSENFDGEWIARIIGRFGFGAARGSTSRGGVKALVRMKRDLAAGRPAAFTLDGPRGPARIAQPGAVWLAGATGHPLLPFHIEADRAWTLRSWDATQIPKPFSRIALAIGPPFYVDGTEPAVLDQRRRELELELQRLEARARQMLSGTEG